MTDTQSADKTVTAEALKARLDEQSANMHGKECSCPGTADASVEDMLAVQSDKGGFEDGPWTEERAAEILAWWASPLEAKDIENEPREYTAEDVDSIVDSIIKASLTPAEERTGMSDRKAAVLDGLAMVRANLATYAANAAVFALAAKSYERHPNVLTAAVKSAAQDEVRNLDASLTKALDMLTAVVKSMP